MSCIVEFPIEILPSVCKSELLRFLIVFFHNYIKMNGLVRTESKFKEAVLESKHSKDEPVKPVINPYE